MRTKLDISVERLFPSGGIRLSAIVANQRVTCAYFGYSLREAKQAFRFECSPKEMHRRFGTPLPKSKHRK